MVRSVSPYWTRYATNGAVALVLAAPLVLAEVAFGVLEVPIVLAPLEVDDAAFAAAALPVADAPAAPAVIADVVGMAVAPDVALTLVATPVGASVAADCAIGPVNSGGPLWRPTTPCVSTATSSTGTSPRTGTSHHQRHAGTL
jgi:hypothetical protein